MRVTLLQPWVCSLMLGSSTTSVEMRSLAELAAKRRRFPALIPLLALTQPFLLDRLMGSELWALLGFGALGLSVGALGLNREAD